MPTLEEIQKQVKMLQDKDDFISKLFTRKEIKELPNILWDDEKVIDLIAGTYNKGNGLLVATNKRLIFIDKGLLWGLKVEDFPYEKISSIQYEKGLIFGSIVIFTSGNKAKIEQTTKNLCASFCEHIRAMITKVQHNNIEDNLVKNTTKKQDTANDILNKLEKLSVLKQQGLLTDDEFIAAKKRLLEG